MDQDQQQRYWRANTQIVKFLLSIWFFVGFVLAIVFVEPLNNLSVAGFPLGFWIAQQGAIVVFVLLILTYCVVMDRVERRLGKDE